MSDERVAEHLARYGEWIEGEVGHVLRSSSIVVLSDTVGLDARPPRPLRAVVLAAAAAALVIVVGVVAALRPAGDQSALYTRAGDPEGPLYVLPAEDSGYVVSDGFISSGTMSSQRVTGRLWVGTADNAGTAFRDVVQVCVSPLATECSSMPTPNVERSRIEIDGRFLQVATTDDGSTLVVSDQRDLFHVSVRASTGQEPIELAALLMELTINESGSPALDVESPRVVFATEGNTAATQTDRFHIAAFEVSTPDDDNSIDVSAMTGTPEMSLGALLPAGFAIDEVSLAEEIIDGVSVTKIEFVMPDRRVTRMLRWQASPNRLISVSGERASFTQLIAAAQSLVETAEADWMAALPGHVVFEDSVLVEDD